MEATAATTNYDALITDDVNFRVETRGLHTYGEEGGMHMPNHEATIRINPDGTEMPLWVVGSRYAVVDHKEIIKGFAQALDTAKIDTVVNHEVFGSGCRIYSYFNMTKSFTLGEKKTSVVPFFTLTTSHDGSMRLGFMVGASVGKMRLNVSRTVYGAYAKHTQGINIERTLSEINKAFNAFIEEVLPMWERMHDISMTSDKCKEIIDRAVKQKVLSQRRAEHLAINSTQSAWDFYTQMVKEVSLVTGSRGNEERAFDRNAEVGEFFKKMVDTEVI